MIVVMIRSNNIKMNKLDAFYPPFPQQFDLAITKHYRLNNSNSIEWYKSIPYNTIKYNTIQYNTIPYNAMQCNAMQCNAMQCNAMQCNAIQYSTTHYLIKSILLYLNTATEGRFRCFYYHRRISRWVRIIE